MRSSANLILVIDQLEELFTTTTIGAEDRRLFVRLIAGLARSGAVWVVATLRADFWHRAAEIPELLDLAQGPGRIDLAAPSPAELAEMIRKPAQAAGLGFETHAESGLALDAVIAQDAAASHGPHGYAEAAPGVLPLLSFVLDALYAEDIVTRGDIKLTFATYTALGGLHGAMSRRAEETVAALPAPAQAAVPRLLRMLVTIAGGSERAVVARMVPLARFGENTPARAVIDAFTAARLIVATEDRATPTVRLAHEALIGHWERARQQFAADRRDLETRALIEQQQARWAKAAGKARRQLLLRDPDLANAVDLGGRWGDELDAPTRAFIAASRQRARLVQRLTAAAAVIFAAVALTASTLGVVAYQAQQEAQRQRARAEQTLAAATNTANGLVFNLARRFDGTSGVPVALIKDILERALVLQEQLLRSGATPKLRRSQSAALSDIAGTLVDLGDPNGALEYAQRSRQIMQELLAIDPRNLTAQVDLSLSYGTVGDVQQAQGNLVEALKSYRASLAIIERVAKSFPFIPNWQRYRSATYIKVGNVQQRQDDLAEAMKSFQAGLAITERFAKDNPGGADLQRDLSAVHNSIGDVQQAQGDFAEALTSYQRSFDIAERFAKANPRDIGWQRYLAFSYKSIGEVQQAQGHLAEALTSHQASVAIGEPLAKTDPRNTRLQHDLATFDTAVGRAYFELGNYPAAAVALRQAAEINPNDGALAIWLYLSLARSQDGSALARLQADAAKLDRTAWPFPIVGLFLGTTTAESALSAADKPRDRCTARFHVGEWQLLHNARMEALSSLRLAADICRKDFIEYAASIAELKRLGP